MMSIAKRGFENRSNMVSAKFVTQLRGCSILSRTDTRFARRAPRESDELKGFVTLGSPLGIGQPWAILDPLFGVVSMHAMRGTGIS